MSAEEAYRNYVVASAEFCEAMKSEQRQMALAYYRSESRPIDEAGREKLKAISEQMSMCIKKRVPPSIEDLNKWSATLVKV